MPLEIDRDDSRRTKPCWYVWSDHHIAMFRCPKGHCGRFDHAIAADGTVSPSVVCPEPGCGFHDHIRLKNWDPKLFEVHEP